MERTQNTTTRLVQPVGTQGGRLIATLDRGMVSVEVQTIETFASLRLPLAMLPDLQAFLEVVRLDPAAVIPAEEPPAEEPEAVAESSEPVTEPETEEEATHG